MRRRLSMSAESAGQRSGHSGASSNSAERVVDGADERLEDDPPLAVAERDLDDLDGRPRPDGLRVDDEGALVELVRFERRRV
jgi:hypothetical protein